MLNKKKVIIIGLILVVIVALVLFIMQFIEINPENQISEEYTPQQEISEEDLRNTIVTLYFQEVFFYCWGVCL